MYFEIVFKTFFFLLIFALEKKTPGRPTNQNIVKRYFFTFSEFYSFVKYFFFNVKLVKNGYRNVRGNNVLLSIKALLTVNTTIEVRQ